MESSDTFFYQVGLKLGIDPISEYAERLGLGEKTGIKLKDEKSGLVPTKSWKRKVFGDRWYQGETLSLSVGQGFLLATPLQMAYAFSAIANGGELVRPRLIKKITSHDDVVVEEFSTEVVGTIPLSKKTLAIIKKALRGVVWEDGGTARSLDG